MDLKPISEIKDRSDFIEAFEAAMTSAHERLRTLWTFEKEQNLPKSYLVEFHPKRDAAVAEGSRNDTEGLISALHLIGTAKRTNDESLLYLSSSLERGKVDFIVDCLNPRLLVFHTLSNAELSDRFMLDQVTKYQPEFDHFWLPVTLLEEVEQRELVTGWEAQYDPITDIEGAVLNGEWEMPEDSDEDSSEDAYYPSSTALTKRARIRISIEKRDAFETYRAIQRTGNILPDIPLSAVLAERRAASDADVTARAKIKSNGKVTGRGSDFYAYLQIVNGILDSYENVLQSLETKYWLSLKPLECEEATGLSLAGEPFCIEFSRPIEVSKLLDLMFNCKPPFRLMGSPEEISRDYYGVDAIDLHVNQPVSFEIAPEIVRVYLPEGTCGNALTRIIQSLQHNVDANLQHPSLVS